MVVPGNPPNSVTKWFLLFSSHSSLACKQFGLDVNPQDMLWWNRSSGLCRGHAKLCSRGGRTWGCLSPDWRVHRPHSSTGQDSSVSLWGTQLCPGQALILHTGFCSFSPSLTKNLSVLSRSKPPHSAPLQAELCCERLMDFRPFWGSRVENQIYSSLFSLLNCTWKQITNNNYSDILGVNTRLVSRLYYLFHLPFQLSICSWFTLVGKTQAWPRDAFGTAEGIR